MCQVLLAVAGSQEPKPEPRSFPDPAVSIPVLVVESSRFLTHAAIRPKDDTPPNGCLTGAPPLQSAKETVPTKRTHHVHLKAANASPLATALEATAGMLQASTRPHGHQPHIHTPQSMIWSFDLGLSSCCPASLLPRCIAAIHRVFSSYRGTSASRRGRSLARAQLLARHGL